MSVHGVDDDSRPRALGPQSFVGGRHLEFKRVNEKRCVCLGAETVNVLGLYRLHPSPSYTGSRPLRSYGWVRTLGKKFAVVGVHRVHLGGTKLISAVRPTSVRNGFRASPFPSPSHNVRVSAFSERRNLVGPSCVTCRTPEAACRRCRWVSIQLPSGSGGSGQTFADPSPRSRRRSGPLNPTS